MLHPMHEKALAAWDAAGPTKRRKLRPGESVEVPGLGLPGARISGVGVTVLEYANGTLAPMIPNLAGLLRSIVERLALDAARPLSGAEALFLRQYLGLSQQAVARQLGAQRQTIIRYEKARRVPPQYAATLRLFAVLSLLNELPEAARKRAAKAMAALQDEMARREEGAHPGPEHAPDREPLRIAVAKASTVELAGV